MIDKELIAGIKDALKEDQETRQYLADAFINESSDMAAFKRFIRINPETIAEQLYTANVEEALNVLRSIIEIMKKNK